MIPIIGGGYRNVPTKEGLSAAGERGWLPLSLEPSTLTDNPRLLSVGEVS